MQICRLATSTYSRIFFLVASTQFINTVWLGFWSHNSIESRTNRKRVYWLPLMQTFKPLMQLNSSNHIVQSIPRCRLFYWLSPVRDHCTWLSGDNRGVRSRCQLVQLNVDWKFTGYILMKLVDNEYWRSIVRRHCLHVISILFHNTNMRCSLDIKNTHFFSYFWNYIRTFVTWNKLTFLGCFSKECQSYFMKIH